MSAPSPTRPAEAAAKARSSDVGAAAAPPLTYQDMRQINGAAARGTTDNNRLLEGRVSFAVEFADVDDPPAPSALWYHAAFHTVTAVVGAGVLGLPYTFSYLGWTGGEFCLTVACVTSFYTAYQLASLHEFNGQRHNRYGDLGREVLGRHGAWFVVPFQFAVLVGLGITYTVTAGKSFKGMVDGDCSNTLQGCTNKGMTGYVVLFGCIQLVLSQLPDFHSLWSISLLGAIMSALYSTIAIFASSFADDEAAYYIRHNDTLGDKFFGALSSLGAICFAFGGHSIMLEIQATLAVPPRPVKSMMQGLSAAYAVVVVAYFSVATAGFAAYGVAVNEDILLSIRQPRWLVVLANLFVAIHVAAGFQVYTMPVFEAIETGLARYAAMLGERPMPMRATVRTVYVLAVTLVAAMLPFFADLMGLIGALGFLPSTFILPPLMYVVAHKSRLPQWELYLNYGIMGVFGTVAVAAFFASLHLVVQHAQEYHVL